MKWGAFPLPNRTRTRPRTRFIFPISVPPYSRIKPSKTTITCEEKTDYIRGTSSSSSTMGKDCEMEFSRTSHADFL
jgi:hypothetical protein